MKRVLLCWILLCFVEPAYAQFGRGFSPAANDSTITALHQQIRMAQQDTTRIALLERLSVAYLNSNQSDRALRLLQQGLNLASQLHQPLGLGRIYRGFGNYYHHQKLPLRRIDAYRKAVGFFQQAQRVPEASEAMYQLAKSYAQHADQAKAIEQTNKNLSYARQTGYDRWVGSSYALLYSIHSRFGDRKSAFADLQAIGKVAASSPYLMDTYLANSLFARWYTEQRDYTKAMHYWHKTWLAVQQLGIPIQTVETCSEIANTLVKLKEFHKAEFYLNKGLEEMKKHQPVSASIYTSLANLREQQNRLPEANRAAVMGLYYARKIDSPYTTAGALELLFQLQEKQGKYREALATFHQIKTLNDSLNRVEQIRSINEVESRFSRQRSEHVLKLLRQKTHIQTLEVERTQRQMILYGSIAIGLSVLLLLMVWIAVLNRRHVRELNQQKTEISTQAQKLSELNLVKDKLFSLIGHDLRTPVLNLKSNIELLDQKQLSEEWLGQHTGQLKRTVNSLYHTVDNLLHWAALQKEGMHTRPQAVSLLDLVIETQELFELTILQKNISFAIGPGNALAWADEGHAQIVIRNIIHNALKFTPTGGSIQIDFEQSAAEASVAITDTGIGMASAHPQQAAQTQKRPNTPGETRLGLGLLVCHEFMKRNGGRLEIKSTVGKGTFVKLVFVPGRPGDNSNENKPYVRSSFSGFDSR